MARKSIEGTNAVALFPFLSILCAVIGVLVLMLVSMTIGQVEETAVFADIPIAQVVAEALEVKRLLSLKIDDSDPVRKRRQLEIQKQELLNELGLKEDEIPPEIRVVTDPDKVLVEPSGSGKNRKAFFIDCQQHALIFQDKDHTRINQLDIATSQVLREKLDTIKREADKRAQPKVLDLNITADSLDGQGFDIIFLIRPDGVETYQLAEKVAFEQGARHGAIPVPSFAPLDLSLFAKQAETE